MAWKHYPYYWPFGEGNSLIIDEQGLWISWTNSRWASDWDAMTLVWRHCYGWWTSIVDWLFEESWRWRICSDELAILFGTKPLPKPVLTYCQLGPCEQTSVKFQSKYKYFHARKCYRECPLQSGGHFVQPQASVKCSVKCGMKLLIPSQLQRLYYWSLWMDK